MNETHWQERLVRLAAAGLERRMRVVEGAVGPIVATPDGDKLLFCSNDYLGLAAHPALRSALCEGASRWGAGAAASRLVSGNTGAHDRLEKRLASFMGAPRAVLFPSGYQANVGALTALTDAGDAIFSDALAHASIVDGCRLARAEVHVFRHRDAAHLGGLLAACRAPGMRLVVTDAVFSMDGDVAPLAEIADAAEEHGALVYVDEAHALGVMGPGGRGLTASVGLADRIAVRMGTLGKSLGLAGAFVALGENAADLLLSRARSLLYTTAAPAALAEAALAAVDLVEAGDDLRAALARNVDLFRALAAKSHLPVLDSTTAIQPVMVGDAAKAARVSRDLWNAGVFVQAMRPPTVPEGTSRLRVTLTASHAPGHIEALVDALARALRGPEGKA
ncbi:MAG: 8-amino-7-oxononanoate synthase [Deltaproteobacteria bacterium]|nr:8-amino-7-oxononanoate synthase [Deltaproteobacteria bacterium]